MMSGIQAMMQLTDFARQQQDTLDRLDLQAESLQQQMRELIPRRTEQIRALARVHLDILVDGELEDDLDEAERHATELLQQRDATAAELARQVQAQTDETAQLEQERQHLVANLETAAEALDIAEAELQAQLEADPDYCAQRDRTESAERTALHAEAKASESEEEEQAKGADYRADPLFTYLWQRRFGTADYKGFGPFRWLDAKVARLIGYDDAKLNYRRLAEIPLRLREHANARRAFADGELAKLRALDNAAREASTIPQLEAKRDEVQHQCDEIEARIEATETEIADLLKRRATIAAGEDKQTQRALDTLAAALEQEALASLERDARKTPFPDDDHIVAELEEIDREQRRLHFMLDNLRQSRAKQQQKLEDLTRLRQEIKRKRMDRPGSSFGDSALVVTMLTNFVQGMLDRDALMRVLEEQYRYRPKRTNPNFGSGSFGRSSPWGGGWDGGSRSGGFGGGGFRTGGGLGGGGRFSTGGGF